MQYISLANKLIRITANAILSLLSHVLTEADLLDFLLLRHNAVLEFVLVSLDLRKKFGITDGDHLGCQNTRVSGTVDCHGRNRNAGFKTEFTTGGMQFRAAVDENENLIQTIQPGEYAVEPLQK